MERLSRPFRKDLKIQPLVATDAPDTTTVLGLGDHRGSAGGVLFVKSEIPGWDECSSYARSEWLALEVGLLCCQPYLAFLCCSSYPLNAAPGSRQLRPVLLPFAIVLLNCLGPTCGGQSGPPSISLALGLDGLSVPLISSDRVRRQMNRLGEAFLFVSKGGAIWRNLIQEASVTGGNCAERCTGDARDPLDGNGNQRLFAIGTAAAIAAGRAHTAS